MSKISVAVLTAVVSMAITVLTSHASMAQSNVLGASNPKLAQKAQRKADRKSARAKKNAELKALEQNGYQPGGDQVNYPQNIQDAEKKAGAARAASGQ